jgi:DNA polymerase-1
MKNVLIIDGLNLIHRAKAAMQDAENGITFASLRSIRSLIERFKPDTAYFVMEGVPRRRLAESDGTYKAQRAGMEDSFRVQKNQVADIISRSLPVVLTRHPDHEADDVIAHLAMKVHRDDVVTVVSTDTDFIQLLKGGDSRVNLYSPIKDIFVEAPPYDYVRWKALRGDGADNIHGIPGIGDKRAQKLLSEAGTLEEFFSKKPGTEEIFERNLSLIGFENLDTDWGLTIFSAPLRENPLLRDRLEGLGFSSLVNEKTWPKWVSSFDKLWMQFPSRAA